MSPHRERTLKYKREEKGEWLRGGAVTSRRPSEMGYNQLSRHEQRASKPYVVSPLRVVVKKPGIASQRQAR